MGLIEMRMLITSYKNLKIEVNNGMDENEYLNKMNWFSHSLHLLDFNALSVGLRYL